MTRKTLSIALAVLIALTVLTAIPASAVSISTTVKTTNPGDTLRLRKGPHKGNTPTVAFVTNKTPITLMEYWDDEDPEDWSKVKVKATGAVGYLKNKYIRYFGLDNSDGELDPKEDDDYDYSRADDNDGRGGTSSGTTSSRATIGRVSTNGGAVNIRKSASTSSARLGSAGDGLQLTILGTSGSWTKVRIGKLTGYIFSSYVKEGAYAHTTASRGVNMRKGAGTGYSVIKTLPYDTSILVYYTIGGWSRVKAGSTYGFLYNTYYEFD